MWEYNYDYLAHGLRGYKYIERKRGKNGKWQYIYPDFAEGKRIDAGRRVEEGINHPLTNPNRALLYGRTPGVSIPKTKPNITRNGKASDNTVTTTSPKTSASSKEAVKNLGAEITGKLKDAYDKTLGSEDFKKYKEYKPKRNDILRNLRDTIWNAARAKNDQERQQNIAALKQMLNTAESKYGSTAAKEIWKEYEETIDKYYGFATDAADKYELESSYKALNDFKNVDREVKNQKIGTTEAGFDAEMERWVQRSKKKK